MELTEIPNVIFILNFERLFSFLLTWKLILQCIFKNTKLNLNIILIWFNTVLEIWELRVK